MPELIVSFKDKVCLRFPLSTKPFKVGRATDCDLSLPDESISRLQAEIFWKDGSYYVDAKGQLPTTIDGREITQAPLQSGDALAIGAWKLLLNVGSHSETEVTRLTGKGGDTKILKPTPQGQKRSLRKVILEISNSFQPNKRLEFASETITLGSRPDNNVILKDDYVSGRHAIIENRGGTYFLRDLDSTNGTFFKGARVRETALDSPCEFVLGQTTFTFSWQDMEAREPEKVLPKAASVPHLNGMVGKSPLMAALFAKIQRAAPTENGILINGETGSGKELVARAIHELSPRKKGPYLILNCGAISPTLIESELFGHEKGAFTGAVGRRLGVFEQAQGGTVFLDEIGELPLDLQPKLLRVLENRTLRRVGGSEDVIVDVRVVAATHRNLAEQVKLGKFREDLFYRLYVVPLTVPPLRERPEDIPELARHFMAQSSPDQTISLSSKALDKLGRYPWPGNVRELKNVIMRSLIFCDGATIEPEDIELFETSLSPTSSAPKSTDTVNLSQVEKEAIKDALEKADGNKTKAAKLLGIAKSTLFKKLREYDIPF